MTQGQEKGREGVASQEFLQIDTGTFSLNSETVLDFCICVPSFLVITFRPFSHKRLIYKRLSCQNLQRTHSLP